jgi:hypothetical protein
VVTTEEIEGDAHARTGPQTSRTVRLS